MVEAETEVEKGNRWSTIEKVSGSVTAIAVAITAVLGIVLSQTADAKDSAETKATDLSATTTDLTGKVAALEKQVAVDQDTIDSLKTTNDTLQTQVADLEAQLERVGEEPETGGGGEHARHSGPPITLGSDGDYADLNAPADDNRWGLGTIDSYTSDSVYNSEGTLYFQDVDGLRLDDGEKATFESCSTRTGYTELYEVDAGTLDSSSGLCLRLDSGRFATMELVEETPEAVTIEVTTWELP